MMRKMFQAHASRPTAIDKPRKPAPRRCRFWRCPPAVCGSDGRAVLSLRSFSFFLSKLPCTIVLPLLPGSFGSTVYEPPRPRLEMEFAAWAPLYASHERPAFARCAHPVCSIDSAAPIAMSAARVLSIFLADIIEYRSLNQSLSDNLIGRNR